MNTFDHNREGGQVRSVPDHFFEHLAQRVAEIVREREAGSPRGEAATWPEWMSVETAARYLDVPPERVRKLKEHGQIPFYQSGPGCRVFFNRSELDEWMRGQRVAARQ